MLKISSIMVVMLPLNVRSEGRPPSTVLLGVSLRARVHITSVGHRYYERVLT